MKQSWVVFIIFLYIVLQGWTMIIQVNATGEASVWARTQQMWYLNLTQLVGNSTVGFFSAILTPALIVISVIAAFLGAILLYYPAIFSGIYVWFWWVVCFPIAVGFVVSIISLIRGVHSA